jgi:hypothetical protein
MGLASAWARGDPWLIVAGALLGTIVPFTLLVILPTNQQLLDIRVDLDSVKAAALLARWGRLHAVRSAMSGLAFLVFLVRLATS